MARELSVASGARARRSVRPLTPVLARQRPIVREATFCSPSHHSGVSTINKQIFLQQNGDNN